MIELLYIIGAFVFGACWGSFFNVLIWRLPREKSIGGRSQCPSCRHTLAWYDLIPLLSFFFSGGRCRYCKKPISFRYPLIEVITGFLFALSIYQVMPTDLVSWLVFAKLVVALSVCIVVFVIDLEHFLILDKIIYPAITTIAGLLVAISLSSGSLGAILPNAVAAIASGIPFWLIWRFSKGKWMGFGDVKFVILMGLILGWPGIATALFLSFMLGALTGLGLIAAGKKQMSSKLPFGTFLTLGTVITLFYGPALWEAYWRLFQI